MAENIPQNPTPETASSAGERKWSILCYIPIFNIVTSVICAVHMANSRLCRFHARQGLILFALWFLTIILAIFPVLSLMLWGVVILLHVVGMMAAAAGKETKIPILGDIAMKIPEYHIFILLTGKSPADLENKN